MPKRALMFERSNLTLEEQEIIRLAPPSVGTAELSARVGVSPQTVSTYRAHFRREANAQAALLRAEHTRNTVGDALADLDNARATFRQHYADTKSAAIGRLWLEAIRITVVDAAPDPRNMTDADLIDALLEMSERLQVHRVEQEELINAELAEFVDKLPSALPANGESGESLSSVRSAPATVGGSDSS